MISIQVVTFIDDNGNTWLTLMVVNGTAFQLVHSYHQYWSVGIGNAAGSFNSDNS